MIINGKGMNFEDGITVSEVLDKLEIDSQKVVVEVDMEIVRKKDFSSRKISSKSKVEIIRFVGGG